MECDGTWTNHVRNRNGVSFLALQSEPFDVELEQVSTVIWQRAASPQHAYLSAHIVDTIKNLRQHCC